MRLLPNQENYNSRKCCAASSRPGRVGFLSAREHLSSCTHHTFPIQIIFRILPSDRIKWHDKLKHIARPKKHYCACKIRSVESGQGSHHDPLYNRKVFRLL